MVITALILYKGYKEGRYSDISSLVRAVVESLVYGWPGDPSIKKKKKKRKEGETILEIDSIVSPGEEGNNRRGDVYFSVFAPRNGSIGR